MGDDGKLHFIDKDGADTALNFNTGNSFGFFIWGRVAGGSWSATDITAYNNDQFSLSGNSFIAKKGGKFKFLIICGGQSNRTMYITLSINGTVKCTRNNDSQSTTSFYSTVYTCDLNPGDTISISGYATSNGYFHCGGIMAYTE